MTSQGDKTGPIPKFLFVAYSLDERKVFRTFIKEGQALNWIIKQREAGRKAEMIVYAPIPSDESNKD